MKPCFAKGEKQEWEKLMKEILSKLASEHKAATVEKNWSYCSHDVLLNVQLHKTTETLAAINKITAMASLKASMVSISSACLLSSWQYCK